MVQSLGAMGVWRVSKVQGQASVALFECVPAAERHGGRLLGLLPGCATHCCLWQPLNGVPASRGSGVIAWLEMRERERESGPQPLRLGAACRAAALPRSELRQRNRRFPQTEGLHPQHAHLCDWMYMMGTPGILRMRLQGKPSRGETYEAIRQEPPAG